MTNIFVNLVDKTLVPENKTAVICKHLVLQNSWYHENMIKMYFCFKSVCYIPHILLTFIHHISIVLTAVI